MEQKQGIAHERTTLLKLIMDRNLFGQTEEKLITQHMSKLDKNNDPLMEKEAVRIKEIILSSKTKKELLEKLKAL
ncbi:MAG: hypothetical protein Q4C01_03285 [Clostridia bacterium]|nr:hypothetical protein [Clostridia bacterium]